MARTMASKMAAVGELDRRQGTGGHASSSPATSGGSSRQRRSREERSRGEEETGMGWSERASRPARRLDRSWPLTAQDGRCDWLGLAAKLGSQLGRTRADRNGPRCHWAGCARHRTGPKWSKRRGRMIGPNGGNVAKRKRGRENRLVEKVMG